MPDWLQKGNQNRVFVKKRVKFGVKNGAIEFQSYHKLVTMCCLSSIFAVSLFDVYKQMFKKLE